jgi:hypothetical protein
MCSETAGRRLLADLDRWDGDDADSTSRLFSPVWTRRDRAAYAQQTAHRADELRAFHEYPLDSSARFELIARNSESLASPSAGLADGWCLAQP